MCKMKTISELKALVRTTLVLNRGLVLWLEALQVYARHMRHMEPHTRVHTATQQQQQHTNSSLHLNG